MSRDWSAAQEAVVLRGRGLAVAVNVLQSAASEGWASRAGVGIGEGVRAAGGATSAKGFSEGGFAFEGWI